MTRITKTIAVGAALCALTAAAPAQADASMTRAQLTKAVTALQGKVHRLQRRAAFDREVLACLAVTQIVEGDYLRWGLGNGRDDAAGPRASVVTLRHEDGCGGYGYNDSNDGLVEAHPLLGFFTP